MLRGSRLERFTELNFAACVGKRYVVIGTASTASGSELNLSLLLN